MITRIQWKNHKVLGNLYLDLTRADGTPYSNIVLVGENGCGKTTILKSLSGFLSGGSILEIDYIEYVLNRKTFQVSSNKNANITWTDDNIKRGCHYLFDPQTNTVKAVGASLHNRDNADDIVHYGCVYSKARSGFKTNKIDSVKTSLLDRNKYDQDDLDDFTPIKQLLIDIDSQDDAEWKNISLANHGADITLYEQSFKMYRFKNAFNSFFDDIKYNKIITDADGKKIIFTKFGKEIEIDSLSTGEQQIVFRGAQLLRNSKSVQGGTIFIDEPELSMHPKWQEKIFDYYTNLFKENGVQTSQLFFATHSEAVLRSAISDKDTLIVVLKNDNGVIKGTPIVTPMVLPTITAAEINYFAFNTATIDYHIALFSYLQSRQQLNHVTDVDAFIKQSSLYDASKHFKPSNFPHPNGSVTRYETLPVYVRNAIDHPESGNTFNKNELDISIKLLIELCR